MDVSGQLQAPAASPPAGGTAPSATWIGGLVGPENSIGAYVEGA
jgi:hypothetical protein